MAPRHKSVLVALALAGATALQCARPPVARRTAAASPRASAYSLDDLEIASPLQPLDNFLRDRGPASHLAFRGWLVEIGGVQDSTKGGILLPEQAKEKPSEGTVIAAGKGVLQPVSVAPGDKVLYGKFDGSALKYCGKDHQLIRDDDVLLAYAGEEMTLENVRPVRDRVLMKVVKEEESTASGLALAPGVAEQQQTSIGEVVSVGDGRLASSGKVTPMACEVGDYLKFRDYAGSDIKIQGTDYVVCRMIDCLSKWN